ncbi:glycosyl transferase family protein [Stappia sp. 22II-S9-Z10]|nr:glycosyl transferase family protein [Stappia sp. 22II-S9-Z10]
MAERRLLLLVPGNKMFGQEGALLALGRTLREAGHRVEYLIHAGWGGDVVGAKLEHEAFTVHPLPLGTIWSPSLLARRPASLLGNLAGVWRTSRTLTALLARAPCDAIVVGNIPFGAYLLPTLRRAPVALLWRYGDEPLISSALNRMMSRAVLARADGHVANCDFLARKAAPFAGGPVRVIRNFPVGMETVAAERLGDGPPRRIVYAGQISAHKGVPLLLDAFDCIAGAAPELTLTLAGAVSGVGVHESRAILMRIETARARWGARITYLGHVGDVGALFGEGAVHACPSVWDDPSPNVIVEAKARAVPTVAFARGGIPELICDGVDGVLVRTETAEALAEGLLRLTGDQAFYAAARRAARKSLDTTFNYDRYRDDWLDAVEAAIETARRRRG